MLQIDDAKLNKLETALAKIGHVNDLELEWLQSLDVSVTSDNINDAWHQYLDTQVQPERTNKCTNYNANPDAGLTNVILADLGTGATLTRVDKAAELAAIGLDDVCIDGNVFKLVSGTAGAQAKPVGITGNLNKHSFSLYGMVELGSTLQANLNGAVGLITTTSESFIKIISEDLIPVITGSGLIIQTTGAGQTIYFILNQLEEGIDATDTIIIEGSAATRDADLGGTLNDRIYTWLGNLLRRGSLSDRWLSYWKSSF